MSDGDRRRGGSWTWHAERTPRRRRGPGRGGARLRPRAAADDARRVRRAGEGEGAARAADRRRARPRRARRPPAVLAARRGSARPRWPRIVADEMGVGFQPTLRPGAGPRRATSPRSSRTSTRATCCSSTRSIGCRAPVEEVLYPALEDFKLDVVLGKGPSARSIRLDLPRFTLVAATTRPGRITLPLRERFGFSPRLDYYSIDDLTTIVRRSAGILEVRSSTPRAPPRSPAARAARPRVANRLLRRVRDFTQVRHDGRDRRRHRAAGPRAVRGRRAGAGQGSTSRSCGPSSSGSAAGPVGLSTLAAAVGEETDTVEDVVRAVPAPARVPAPHAAGSGGHRAGVPPPRRGRRGRPPALAERAGSRRGSVPPGLPALALYPPRGSEEGPSDHDPVPSLRSPPTPVGSSPFGLLVPLALMGGLFYFLLIRPQQRRARAQAELLSSSMSVTR